MNQPIVSVVMPTYNGGKYIGRAVESVFAQKVPLELFVVGTVPRITRRRFCSLI